MTYRKSFNDMEATSAMPSSGPQQAARGRSTRPLRNDDDDEPNIPDDAPRLPSGVTHLWVASVMSQRNVVYWSPTAGWKRAKGPTT